MNASITPSPSSRAVRHFGLLKLALTCALVCAIGQATFAQTKTASSGTVEGRVFNSTNNSALANARVTIAGTNLLAITDETGTFRIVGTPTGEVRVEVFYVGMARQSATVTVGADGTANQDFELRREDGPRSNETDPLDKVVQLETFTVVADNVMNAQAVAMNEQRNSPNIKNVVSLEEFGDRGNENLGEFLLFLPGISVNVPGDSGPDQVSLRGFPGFSTGVTVDGASVANAARSVADTDSSRAMDLHDMPMGNASRVEVTKVPTPDMSASGLGGSINVITKSGFEAKKPVFRYTAYSQFHNTRGITFDGGPAGRLPQMSPKYVEPSFSFSYLHPVNKSFALTVGGSSTWRMKTNDDSTRDETPTWNLIDGFQRTSTWQAPTQLYKSKDGQIGMDWRISPTDFLSANIRYKEFSQMVVRSRLDVTYGAGATGNASFVQGATTGVGSVTQGTGGWYEHNTATKQADLRYRHRGSVWRIDASASYSTADYRKEDIDDGHFDAASSTITNLIIRGDEIPASGGIPRRITATTRTGTPVDIYNGANYSITSGTSNQLARETEFINGRLDFSRELSGTLPLTIKTGIAVNQEFRDYLNYTRTWAFTPNGMSTVAARTAGNFNVFDEEFYAGAPTIYGIPLRDVSAKKLYDLYLQNPSWFVLNEAEAWRNYARGSKELTEVVSAAYFRVDGRFLKNKLWVVAGVRYERTDDEGRGLLNDISARYQRDANGNILRNSAGQPITIVADAVTLDKLQYKERAAYSKRNYDGFYPSVNATYTLNDHLLLRGAYAKTLSRPNISEIIPGTNISSPDAADLTISVSNTGLIPWTANNFDLSLESYDFKGGFGSIGVFHKSIKNFFGAFRTDATPELLELYGLPTDGTLAGYDIVTQTNAGDAKISGVEFSYRQSLTFLPEWARGVQVFFNATKLRLESDDPTANFSGFNPSSIAGGINLIRNRYLVRLTYSYQGETRRGLVAESAGNGIPADTYNYLGERTRWGVNAEFKINKYVSLYGTITDLGGMELRDRRYAPNTPEYAKGNRIQDLGYYTTIGIKGTF